MVGSARKIFKIFAITTVAALLVRMFVFENYHLGSASMSPGLLAGDFIAVFKSSFNLRLPFTSYEIFKVRGPSHSEVVLFAIPDHGNETFLKRVVAVGGDKVQIKDGVLLINDQAAQYRSFDEPLPTLSREIAGEGPEAWAVETAPSGKSYGIRMAKVKSENYGPITVPSRHLFVMSDNRAEKSDSRTWGPIPFSELRGKAIFVWFSKELNGKIRRDRCGAWVD